MTDNVTVVPGHGKVGLRVRQAKRARVSQKLAGLEAVLDCEATAPMGSFASGRDAGRARAAQTARRART